MFIYGSNCLKWSIKIGYVLKILTVLDKNNIRNLNGNDFSATRIIIAIVVVLFCNKLLKRNKDNHEFRITSILQFLYISLLS